MDEKIKEIKEWLPLFKRVIDYNPPDDSLAVKVVDYLDTLLTALKEKEEEIARLRDALEEVRLRSWEALK